MQEVTGSFHYLYHIHPYIYLYPIHLIHISIPIHPSPAPSPHCMLWRKNCGRIRSRGPRRHASTRFRGMQLNQMRPLSRATEINCRYKVERNGCGHRKTSDSPMPTDAVRSTQCDVNMALVPVITIPLLAYLQ